MVQADGDAGDGGRSDDGDATDERAETADTSVEDASVAPVDPAGEWHRRLLAAAGVGVAATTAGCGGGDGGDGTTTAGDTGTTTGDDTDGTTAATATPTSATSTTSAPPPTADAEPAPLTSPSSRLSPRKGFADTAWLTEEDLQVVTVTNLDASGEGSFRAAVNTEGPRLIVFEVGGVIDLEGEGFAMEEPYGYIAGQTAPDPGITIVRGGFGISAHHVVCQHIRVRPGDEGGNGSDSLSIGRTNHVVIDHCSATWSVDENMSTGGQKFCHHVTFSNNINGEGLAHSIHPEGEHSKGTLLLDGSQDVSIYGNCYTCNVDRYPRMKGATSSVFANNVCYNHKEAAQMGGAEDLGPMSRDLPEETVAAFVGNHYRAGPITPTHAPIVYLDHRIVDARVFHRDNVTEPEMPFVAGGIERLDEPPLWPDELRALPSGMVHDHVLSTAGARPANRVPHDRRMIEMTRNGTGRIIDSQAEVGGYPDFEPAERALSVPDPGEERWAWLFDHTRAVELPEADAP